MSKPTCSACGAHVSPHDGVYVGYKEGTKFMCSRCYNESIAEDLGDLGDVAEVLLLQGLLHRGQMSPEHVLLKP